MRSLVERRLLAWSSAGPTMTFLARSLGAFTVALGAALGGCAPNALVALPSSAARWIDDTTAAATKAGVTVEARTSDFPGAPALDLGGRATPLFVLVDNAGTVPLRVSRSAFALVSGTARFQTVAPEMARPPSGARALPMVELAPGASVSGFLFFEPVVGDWGFVNLRATLTDAANEVTLETIDVPFMSGHRCARRARGGGSSGAGEAWLFRACAE